MEICTFKFDGNKWGWQIKEVVVLPWYTVHWRLVINVTLESTGNYQYLFCLLLIIFNQYHNGSTQEYNYYLSFPTYGSITHPFGGLLIMPIKYNYPGTEINYFFPVANWLLISRGPAKFLRAQFYFSVDEKEKSKHSDINE